MLCDYINSYQGVIEDANDRNQFVRMATKNIKDRLFSFYVNERKNTSQNGNSTKEKRIIEDDHKDSA